MYLICHCQNPKLLLFPLLGQFDFNQLIWMSYIRILGIRYSGVCFQLLEEKGLFLLVLTTE